MLLDGNSLRCHNEIKYVKTGTCFLTFSGKSIPRSVNLYGLDLEVENYIMPVTQCYNCFLFGHTKNQCRGKLNVKNALNQVTSMIFVLK